MPTLAETTAIQAAAVLDGLGTEGFSDRLFDRTDTFVRFVRSEVIEAAWVKIE